MVDYRLEEAGRLTRPMRYDRASDKYVPVEWAEALTAIGADLKAMNPEKVVLYSSGRTSLEASYMYGLFGRIYGTNNFPDSSNMCHESTSVALPESIGVPVGTVTLDDFEHTDCIFFFGQNVGSNAPRMLHQLAEARERDAEIITFNPLRERGLERFANPQNPIETPARQGQDHLDAISPGALGRRHRGDLRHGQGHHRRRRRGEGERHGAKGGRVLPGGSHQRVRGLRPGRAGPCVGRSSRPARR